jgi:Protein of unknown function (DUF1364)
MIMSKITQSAKGENCTIRVPMVCNYNPTTTVLCHLSGVRFGHGVAKKVSDIHAAYGCSDCHDAVDGRNAYANATYSKIEREYLHLQGVIETQLKLINKGLL